LVGLLGTTRGLSGLNGEKLGAFFSTDRWTGIVMYTEGSCIGLNLIVDEIKVSCLTVVLSLGEADALSRRVFPSGSGGMVWVLSAQTDENGAVSREYSWAIQ